MTIYVDQLRKYSQLRWMSCHMMADGEIAELHQMAINIGIPLNWFRDSPLHPHYDISPRYRAIAVKLGAVSVNDKEMVKRCSKLFHEQGADNETKITPA